MFVVCLFVAMPLFWLVYRSEKRLYNPTVFFIGFFGLCGFISGLHIKQLYSPSDYIYVIVILSLLSFFLGYIVAKKIKIHPFEHKATKLRIILYTILLCLSIAFGIVKLVTIIPLVRQGVSLAIIRTLYSGETVRGISYNSNIFKAEVYFCKPFIQIVMPIFCVLVTNRELSKKTPKSIIILSAITILLNQIVTGGRSSLFIVGVLIIVALRFQYDIRIKDIIMRNFKLFLLIILLVILMYWITRQRTNLAIIDSVFYYFCAPLVAFSEELYTITNNPDRSYGLVLISGFIRPLYVIFRNFFNIDIRAIDIIYDLHKEVNVYFNISPNKTYNAFVTLFYYFYLDGGLLGCVLDSFIYSLFCNLSYNLARIRKDFFGFVMYLLIFQSLILSFVRYQYIDVSNALAFLYLIAVFKISNSDDYLEVVR